MLSAVATRQSALVVWRTAHTVHTLHIVQSYIELDVACMLQINNPEQPETRRKRSKS